MRLTGIIEGYSYLLLLFVAMPLKYFAGIAKAVSVVGSIHGLLFILFMYAIVFAMRSAKLKLKHGFRAALASLIPFATFFLDKSIFDEYRK
jgi:integral membrane protein